MAQEQKNRQHHGISKWCNAHAILRGQTGATEVSPPLLIGLESIMSSYMFTVNSNKKYPGF